MTVLLRNCSTISNTHCFKISTINRNICKDTIQIQQTGEGGLLQNIVSVCTYQCYEYYVLTISIHRYNVRNRR
jgi:hypothetical protein